MLNKDDYNNTIEKNDVLLIKDNRYGGYELFVVYRFVGKNESAFVLESGCTQPIIINLDFKSDIFENSEIYMNRTDLIILKLGTYDKLDPILNKLDLECEDCLQTEDVENLEEYFLKTNLKLSKQINMLKNNIAPNKLQIDEKNYDWVDFLREYDKELMEFYCNITCLVEYNLNLNTKQEKKYKKFVEENIKYGKYKKYDMQPWVEL